MVSGIPERVPDPSGRTTVSLWGDVYDRLNDLRNEIQLKERRTMSFNDAVKRMLDERDAVKQMLDEDLP